MISPIRLALASLLLLAVGAKGLAGQETVSGETFHLSAPHLSHALQPPGVIAAHQRAIDAALSVPDRQVEARKNRRKGALWGGLIGAVVGGVSAGLSVDSGDTGPLGEAVEAAATGPAVVVGAIVGGAIGALLGATVFAPGT